MLAATAVAIVEAQKDLCLKIRERLASWELGLRKERELWRRVGTARDDMTKKDQLSKDIDTVLQHWQEYEDWSKSLREKRRVEVGTLDTKVGIVSRLLDGDTLKTMCASHQWYAGQTKERFLFVYKEALCHPDVGLAHYRALKERHDFVAAKLEMISQGLHDDRQPSRVEEYRRLHDHQHAQLDAFYRACQNRSHMTFLPNFTTALKALRTNNGHTLHSINGLHFLLQSNNDGQPAVWQGYIYALNFTQPTSA